MFRVVFDSNILCEVEQFVFNDGSVQVKIAGDVPSVAFHAMVEARIQSPADQMGLVMLVNAIRTACPGITRVDCIMPFTPYGRQDAPFCKGEANAMKAWADVVNSLGFQSIMILDPHSIAVSHLNNLVIVDIVDVLRASHEFQIDPLAMTLVSPDAGANKKCHKIAKEFGFEKLIRADKARNLATGEIIETEVYGDVDGDTCLIVDDLCDGGLTFIKLAEALRAKGAVKVILFVTHGIFSKGLSVFEGLIDEVYTTESWMSSPGITEGYTGKFTICGGEDDEV